MRALFEPGDTMIYLIIFLVVWLALILFSRLIIRWPSEADEIRRSYGGRLLLKGFLSPKFLENKLTGDHLRIFVRFRRRYLLFWVSILVLSAVLILMSYFQFTSDSEDFKNRMEETYLGK